MQVYAQFVVPTLKPNLISYAKISVRVDHTFQNERIFLDALTVAISHWIKQSETGRRAVQDKQTMTLTMLAEHIRSFDYDSNLDDGEGDSEPDLSYCLEQCGIREMTIDIIHEKSPCTNWHLETPLFSTTKT